MEKLFILTITLLVNLIGLGCFFYAFYNLITGNYYAGALSLAITLTVILTVQTKGIQQ